jgi:hypothetical protein
MNTCLECGKETSGSIGAAGIKWERICQECKDIADKALKNQVEIIGKVYDIILGGK